MQSEGSHLKSDEHLLAAVASGDEAAFEAIVTRHEDAVYRFLVRLVGDRDAAEDALQETFLAILRRSQSFRGEGSGKGWIFSVARNAGRLELRKRGRRIEADDSETLESLGLSAGWGEAPPDPEALAARREASAALGRALDVLSAEDREVLILRDVEGFSGEETAGVLGVELRAMKSRLHRARLRLAAALRKGGFDG